LTDITTIQLSRQSNDIRVISVEVRADK